VDDTVVLPVRNCTVSIFPVNAWRCFLSRASSSLLQNGTNNNISN